MEAKDIVMSDEEIRVILVKCGLMEFLPNRSDRMIAQAQSEISFRAGRRDVVKWVNHFVSMSSKDYLEWKRQLRIWFEDNPELLKKWGIDE